MLLKINSSIQKLKIRSLTYGAVKSWYSGLVKKPPPIPPYNHIVQIGDPILRLKAENVSPDDIQNEKVQYLIRRLRHVANTYNCVGLSAPQIGVPSRVILIEFNKRHAKDFTKEEFKNREMDFLKQTVIINPKMKVVDYTKVTHTEACGSVKGFMAEVPRYSKVLVEGLSENNEKVLLSLNGWLARILQHEVDHLDGCIFTDIMKKRSLICSCWNVVNERRGKVELPFSN